MKVEGQLQQRNVREVWRGLIISSSSNHQIISGHNTDNGRDPTTQAPDDFAPPKCLPQQWIG